MPFNKKQHRAKGLGGRIYIKSMMIETGDSPDGGGTEDVKTASGDVSSGEQVQQQAATGDIGQVGEPDTKVEQADGGAGSDSPGAQPE